MATRGRRWNTQVVVALIGTAGVLAAALVTALPSLLEALGSRPGSSAPRTASPTVTEPGKPPATPSPAPAPAQAGKEADESAAPADRDPGLASAKKQAEQMAREWVTAFVARNVDTLVRLSKPPVCLNMTRLTSLSDVRTWYTELVADPKFPRGLLGSMEVEVGTIDEYRKLGQVSAGDRFLSAVPLRGNDLYGKVQFQVLTRTKKGNIDIGFTLYFRRVGDGVELAGWWGG